MFVSSTVSRYHCNTGSIAKRYGGGPKKTATNKTMVRNVIAQIGFKWRKTISIPFAAYLLENELKLDPTGARLKRSQRGKELVSRLPKYHFLQ